MAITGEAFTDIIKSHHHEIFVSYFYRRASAFLLRYKNYIAAVQPIANKKISMESYFLTFICLLWQ
jgi:hypothetical protein